MSSKEQQGKFNTIYRLILPFVLLFIFSGGVFAASFTLYGKVFNPGWSTGTAATANSYCGLRAYRIGISGQVGDQNIGPDSNCPQKIFPAYYSGLTTPAYFNSDVGSYDWTTLVNVGQEVVTIAQAYKDQFSLCQWIGDSYVGAVKKTITQSDIDDGSADMPAMQLQAIPQPVSQVVNYYDATLTWIGLSNDPYNLINSYTVYRSTNPVSGYTAVSWTAAQNPGATVTFKDINLTPNTTYYYKIAVNYSWGGGGGAPAYYTTEATSNTIAITTKSIFTSGLVYVLTTPASDITVSTGQFVTIIARTTNISGAPLYVTPSALTLNGTPGALVLQSGPNPAAQNVPNGADRYFTWIYRANVQGIASFTGVAYGQNNSNGNLYISNETTSSEITIENAASLLAARNVQPPTSASIGQYITVFLTVTNTGTANCNNTSAGITVVGVSGTNTITAITLISAPSSSVTVPGGNNSYTFTWTYSAAGTGTVYFSCYATGYDENSNNTVNAIASPSGNLVLQTPANLTSDIIAPASVSINQVFTVLMRVTNTGQAGANNITPSLLLTGGTVSLLSGPTPSNFNLSGGQTANFTWTYSATGTGTVNFSGYASGTDANTGLTKQSNSMNLNTVIQTSPSLSASLVAYPSQVSVGQTITLVLSVTNSGQALAHSVSPTPQLLGESVTGLVSYTGGPTSDAPWNIAGGASKSYTWTYRATNAGVLTFSGRVSGYDANENTVVLSNTATSPSVNIQTAANLVVNLTLSQTTISTGNNLTVYLSVTNVGQAACNNVTPEINIVSYYGAGYSLVSGPTPSSASIPGNNGSAVFTWIYSMDSAGSLNFNARAGGQDANSNATVYSTYSNRGATVQTRAALQSSIASIPEYVGVGWTITVVMSVTNTGQASAINVSPSLIIAPSSSGSA
ncbi:MAG: hypothetical protein N3E50_07495, partial [Candidatus Goldbacteria bacterium]|nr:hypothetical protein [Candidatus Goldiibacteriota bacterium]